MAKTKQSRKPRKAGSRPKGSGERGGFTRFAVYWLSVLVVWGLIAVTGVIFWYAYDLPSVDALRKISRQPTITLVSRDGRRIATYGDLYGQAVAIKDLPAHLPQAVVATEDHRFYRHFGIDLIGLARAAYVNLREGRIVQGGSTITQQLAKNAFLTPERTLKRKVQEFLLALWLEYNFSKDQILSLYLNRVYLGAGTYGVTAAARKYFNKPASKLTVAEAAMLAGLLKAPSRYSPRRNYKAAVARSRIVLANMVKHGYLSKDEAQRGRVAPAKLRRGRAAGSGAGYFGDWVVARVPSYVGHADRDLTVVTSLDSKLQRASEAIVADALARNDKKFNIGQGALLAMTPDGAVVAMVGGRNYATSQFNRVTQARRQPGSAFKPVVYLAGLEAGLRPDTVMQDKPLTIGTWSPRNYSNKYAGAVTLSAALARSINTVAVKVWRHAGARAVARAARRLGIESRIAPHPSSALGASEVTLLELTAAYATIANGGQVPLPHAILEIRDKAGEVLYRRSGSGFASLADGAHLDQLGAMLQAVITEGTGKRAKLDRPSAGKTGTSQSYRDAWFVGYTGDYVAGVWFGNDDGKAMRRVTGGGLPASTWRRFMTTAHKGIATHALRKAPAEIRGFFDRLFGKLSESGGSDDSGDKDIVDTRQDP